MSAPQVAQVEVLDRSFGKENTLVFTTHEKPLDGSNDPDAAWDTKAAAMIGEVLHSHYRGHDWMAFVERKQGVARIWINGLMSQNYPYVVKLDTFAEGPDAVIRAGGELLERFNIPRSGVDFGLIAQIKAQGGLLLDRRPPPGGMIRGG
jgi:hypothetical protein